MCLRSDENDQGNKKFQRDCVNSVSRNPASKAMIDQKHHCADRFGLIQVAETIVAHRQVE